MRTAIFYTGCLRTFEKTMKYNMKNLITQRDPEVKIDIFACIQNDTQYNEIIIIEKLIKCYIDSTGNTVIRHIKFFDINNPEFKTWINKQVDNINLNEFWNNYLKTSGSVIEYVQFGNCWEEMVKYEVSKGITYDYIIRLRTDVVVAIPLDLSLLHKTEKTQEGLMNWLSVERNNYIKEKNEIIPENDVLRHEDKWIFSIRRNVFYIMPRITAEIVSRVGSLYGTIGPHTLKQQEKFTCWCDAESQLQLYCLHNGVVIFDSLTNLEETSLYQFNRDNYFYNDEAGEHLISNHQFAIFIHR